MFMSFLSIHVVSLSPELILSLSLSPPFLESSFSRLKSYHLRMNRIPFFFLIDTLIYLVSSYLFPLYISVSPSSWNLSTYLILHSPFFLLPLFLAPSSSCPPAFLFLTTVFLVLSLSSLPLPLSLHFLFLSLFTSSLSYPPLLPFSSCATTQRPLRAGTLFNRTRYYNWHDT